MESESHCHKGLKQFALALAAFLFKEANPSDNELFLMRT